MPRPTDKQQLLDLSKKNFERLMELIQAIPDSERSFEFPEGTLNRNITDVIAHLHEWHLMFRTWYEIGMSGQKPVMPAEGYTWKTLPLLNRKIWEQYRYAEHDKVLQDFKESYKKIMALIESHSDEELFEKKRYKWTGSTSLGAYLISCTSSHYDWGYKLIKKCRKKALAD